MKNKYKGKYNMKNKTKIYLKEMEKLKGKTY
jgi:hypothetical protein